MGMKDMGNQNMSSLIQHRVRKALDGLFEDREKLLEGLRLTLGLNQELLLLDDADLSRYAVAFFKKCMEDQGTGEALDLDAVFAHPIEGPKRITIFREYMVKENAIISETIEKMEASLETEKQVAAEVIASITPEKEGAG